jgi:phosphonate transport system substrate-binding protein
LLHRLKQGEVDLAWLAPIVALDALRSDVSPVALPARGDTSWYWAALFIRDDSPLFGLATLQKARVAWVDERSASGYLVIRAALEAEGFDVDRGFSSQIFTRSHDAVVREVLADPYVVGATYLHLDKNGSVSRAGWGDAKVRELKRAGPIPSDVLAAGSTLKPNVVERIRSALCENPPAELADAALPLFGARRFTPVGHAEFAHLRALERYLIRSASLPS